jgi:hypothetical protein
MGGRRQERRIREVDREKLREQNAKRITQSAERRIFSAMRHALCVVKERTP